MARYQPPGGRGTQPRGLLPARQLPPADPAPRQRAVAAIAIGVLSLLGLALGLGNLHRSVLVAVVTLVFGATAIWLGARASRRGRGGGAPGVRGDGDLARPQREPAGAARRDGPAARVGHRDRARRVRPSVQRAVAAGAGGVLVAAEHVLQLH